MEPTFKLPLTKALGGHIWNMEEEHKEWNKVKEVSRHIHPHTLHLSSTSRLGIISLSHLTSLSHFRPPPHNYPHSNFIWDQLAFHL